MENRQAMDNLGDLSDQRNLVAFRLGRQAYALPIEPVVKIIEMVTITPIPQVSSSVEGVINVRGVAVPVINLRRHFGLPEVPWGLRTPIILVQIGEQMYGLIVDEVIDVLGLAANRISRVIDILPEGMSQAPVIQGVAHVQDDTVLLLNIEHLLLPTHIEEMVQAVTDLPDATVEEAPEDMEVDPATVSTESLSEILVEEMSQDRKVGRATMLVDGFEQGVES
ncbi:MAG: chemotaxis protein CheW [Anaerolineae bacterium]